MKILAIRGCNLASLEGDFEIDFTAEPLKSAGIFAITGQTGAGKSTLLDVICLALFDNAPRLNKAENVTISDVEDKTIGQKDSRNILRRGASEGFAEVDFIALNGDKYRTRWMVRRARGKADGALQATTMRVENLSTKSEEQGTKSNLLSRIVELIGLTFDQFTRAVLLAQGDFANFLKAKSNEKAELLEKLTGTDIYSKISVSIYQKSQDAKMELDLLLQRIKDIRLLSDDELGALQQEKQTIAEVLIPLQKDILLIEKKLSWIKQEEQILQEITQAKSNLLLVQQQIQESAPRYLYMDKIQASMDIRDVYNAWNQKNKLIEKLYADLQTKQKEIVSVDEQYEQLKSRIDTAKTAIEDLEKRYEKAKPDIDKAKEIDLFLKDNLQKLSNLQAEIDTAKKQKERSDSTILTLKKEQEQTLQTQANINKWFAEYSVYENIIPKTELISNIVDTTFSIRKNKLTIAKSLEVSRASLLTFTEQLKQEETEAERLNELLPTEVLNLRHNLQENQACPVCGSTHHPFKDKLEQSLRINEEELEKSKTKIQESILKTKQNIENIQKSITEFDTYLQSYQQQLDENIKSIAEHLSAYPDWQQKMESNALQSELKGLALKWAENKQLLDSCTNTQSNILIKLDAEQKTQTSVTELLFAKQEQYQKQDTLLKQQTEERMQLLGGKSIEFVENYFSNNKALLSKQYEEIRQYKEKIENTKSALLGSKNQLEKDIESNKLEVQNLHTEINTWVSHNPYQIDVTVLQELVSKPREWIVQEQQYLNDIKNKELVLKTTLVERENRLQKHLESEDKVLESESRESLNEYLVQKQKEAESKTNRLNEINVALLAHQRGKDQTKAFEKDIETKQALYDNWAKLNELFGSASGNKFKTIAQGYTLDILLSYANVHLHDLSKRYKLQKIPNSLGLQVVDNDMYGEVRSVHSLSGGESFLISLALALGLSSLSSNRMKIESLFIDEGFGALDIDTLSVAMDALDNLQTQGRKIGVISHVEEMKERISTQIQVTKSANGKSVIQIIG